MKFYPEQSPGCSAVGASAGAVDPKTHRKQVWVFIDAITNLVDVVVSKLQRGDTTDCDISKDVEGWPVARPWFSFFPESSERVLQNCLFLSNTHPPLPPTTTPQIDLESQNIRMFAMTA